MRKRLQRTLLVRENIVGFEIEKLKLLPFPFDKKFKISKRIMIHEFWSATMDERFHIPCSTALDDSLRNAWKLIPTKRGHATDD